MHLPDASSLLFGSYVPPPEISQLSSSTILRHDIYESVFGNAFNPIAPIGLAPQGPIFLPTLDFPCLAPPPSLPAQTDLPVPASHSALPDLLQSTSPPGHPACSKRVSMRKRSVACPEKARIHISHLSSKQRITAFTPLPPPPPQSPLVRRGHCVVLSIEAATRVAWLRPPCRRRFSSAIREGRPRPLRAFTSTAPAPEASTRVSYCPCRFNGSALREALEGGRWTHKTS